MPRRIVVSSPTGPPLHFVEGPADNEAELQGVLLRHPELLPADDLGFDDDLLVIGRETPLASGMVDLLLLARTGDIVIVEFKTGPQNPDFRSAIAQVIDYGSDLWQLRDAVAMDEGVVRRYLAGPYAPDRAHGVLDLRSAAERTWALDDDGWLALVARLDEVLVSGDFLFVVAAQRFTPQMHDVVQYLNSVTRAGRYFLVEVIRLDASTSSSGGLSRAFAAQVVARPVRAPSIGSGSRTSEAEFLGRVEDPDYHEALSDLLSAVESLGLVTNWSTKGASIRLRSPDRNEPLSIGWTFLDGDQWSGARHVTLGVDPKSLISHPSLVGRVDRFVSEVAAVPGGAPHPGTLHAKIFEPTAVVGAKTRLIAALERLVAIGPGDVPVIPSQEAGAHDAR